MSIISERIMERIKYLDLSYDDVARLCHMPKSTLYRYATGARENVPAGKLQEIAAALGTTPAYLMGLEDTPSPATATGGVTDEDIKFALFNGADGITDEMYEEVKRFAQFIKERENR